MPIYHQINTNNYTFISLIGTGTYGTVFKARNVATGEVVAVKYIDLKNATEQLLINVCREICINIYMSSLKTNIYSVTLLDIFLPSAHSSSPPNA